jgi:hypothetical protein
MEDQLEQAIEIAAGGTRDPALKQQVGWFFFYFFLGIVVIILY